MLIQDTTNRFQIIWDLGRRCSFACSYCPPHRNNKWSKFIDLNTLCSSMDKVVEYVELYNTFRTQPYNKKISFTGGEPTVHPDFFEFLKYIKNNYLNFSRGLTTNGWFSNKILDNVLKYTTGGTVSYHCETNNNIKKKVIENAIALKNTFKVNVMFHKDYFKECVDVCDTLEKYNVDYVPRIIGDDIDNKSIEKGYAHQYNRQQMQWFRNYWTDKGQQVGNEGSTFKGLGRPCCGNRCFLVDNKETRFLQDTNFENWSCMINWYFLYLNSELDLAWTHQTCNVNLEGKVAPIGKISELDTVVDNLTTQFYTKKELPLITCPKTFCGCGLCITKATTSDELLSSANLITKNINLKPIQKQDVSYDNAITIKKSFEILDHE